MARSTHSSVRSVARPRSRVDSARALIVLEGLEEFREHLGGELAITLLKAIGKGFEVHEVNVPKIVEAIHELRQRHEQRDRKTISATA